MMDLLGKITGIVRVELTSADITGTLSAINRMKIPVKDVEPVGNLSVRFTISRSDLGKIQAIAVKKNEKIEIVFHKGVFWLLYRLRERFLLLLSVVILICLTLYLPSRVLFIEVEGNRLLPDQLIREAAYDAGIYFGASRREVRSEEMKNELLGKLPQLQWAGVNTYGCVATITVKERMMVDDEKTADQISRIVASCDGVITSLTVTKGSGQCTVGQAVQKGQTLISGYTECGDIILAGRAEGEVFAQTRHEIRATTQPQVKIRSRIRATRTNYSLCIGKKRINLYKGSGISDASCAKIVTQYHLALPGGYVLPLTLIKEQYTVYQLNQAVTEYDQLRIELSDFMESILSGKGVALVVTDSRESFEESNELVVLNGVYACVEMIGREQGEQIGDFYGKAG